MDNEIVENEFTPDTEGETDAIVNPSAPSPYPYPYTNQDTRQPLEVTQDGIPYILQPNPDNLDEYIVIDEDGIALGSVNIPPDIDADQINILDNLLPLGMPDINVIQSGIENAQNEKVNPKTGCDKDTASDLILLFTLAGALVLLIEYRRILCRV